MNTYGAKTEICKGPCSCAGHWFLQWQKWLGSSAEEVTGNPGHSCCVAECPWPSLFLSLYISSLTVSGCVETKVDKLLMDNLDMWYTERLGKLAIHPTFPFPVSRILCSWKFSLSAKQCWSRGMEWCQQNEIVLPFFFWSYSQGFFFPTMLLKFSKWSLELFQSCFCLWVVV